MSSFVLCMLIFAYVCLTLVFSMQVIPERAEVYYINESYAKDVVINVRKLGRRGGYVANLNFTLLYDAGNNISADILFYEFLHNEYKRTFVEMHFRLCDMITNDELVGKAVRIAGITSCPVKAGIYSLQNLSIPNVENFPYVWPFERARAVGSFLNPKTGNMIGNGSIYITFKQKKSSKKS